MKKVLSIFLGTLILLSTLSPLSVLAGNVEQYDEECVSDWVLESAAPEGAHIVDTKWDYDLQTRTKRTDSNYLLTNTTFVWDEYGAWSDWSTKKVDETDSRNVETRDVKAVYGDFWYYSRSVNSAGTLSSYDVNYHPNKQTIKLDYRLNKIKLVDGHQAYGPYAGKNNEYGTYLQNRWWNESYQYEKIKDAYTEYRYRDRTKIYIYWYSVTSYDEISPEDATGTDVISNVQKKVRYLLELDVFDETTDTHIAKNGIIYSINRTDKTATVSSYQNLDETVESIEVTIPSRIVVDNEFYSVTAIGNNAFDDCSILTKINIPSSVTSIGAEAFIYCSSLEEIVIPSSVESIGESAFESCTGLEKAIIGNGVKTIGANAFKRCNYLAKVSLGKSIEYIDEYAFSNCSRLISIYFIGEKPEIATNAFERRSTSTTNFTISFYYNSTKTSWYGIGGWKDGVGFVTKLYLTQTEGYTNPADWIKYINWYVYDQGDIIYLDENGYDFQGNQYTCADGTATLTRYDEAENIVGGDICIPSKVFFNAAEYQVNAIGNNLFKDCKTLTRISIGDNITTIGANAFENCTDLISVTYGSGVRTISAATFKNCTSLRELYFKGDVPTSVASDSFSGVPSDAFAVRYNGKDTWPSKWQNFTVYICDVLTAVGNTNYFKDKTGVFYTVLSEENKKAIVGKKISTTTEDPENAQNTGYSGTEAIIIADFVDINGDMYMVSGLDRFAFFNSKIPSITLGRFIGYGMTDEQPGIWDCTFRQCNNLKSVTVSAENKVYYSADGVLYKYDATLTTTPTLLMLYPIAKEGTSFTVPNGVTSINQYAFAGQNKLQSVNLNSVVTVGDHAFANCIYLKTATMNSVRTIEKQAFFNCSSLSSVNLSQIDTIGDQAFFGCASLGSVTLNGINKIGRQAFVGCDNVKAFSVSNSSNYSSDSAGVLFEADGNNKKLLQYPAGSTAAEYTLSDVTVNAIEPYAFSGAVNLSKINLSDSLVSIGEHAFDNCTSVENIYIGTSVTSIGTRAFDNCLALKGFSVAQSNMHYYADENGVLYGYATDGEGGLVIDANGATHLDTLVCYPAALQRNAYTVLSGITTLSSGAFANNTHLIRVIIPSTIDKVRDEVFAGCTNLAEIYFKGEIPKEFGEGVVNSTSKDLIVYYLAGNNTWKTDPIPKALSGCTIKEYNAIEELPNNISYVNSYAIIITNSEGKAVTNSTVTANGVSATYTNGMYVFGMPEGYDAKEGIKVSVVTPSYYSYENTLFLDEELHLSYITIKKQSTIQGISCENVDINTKTHSINKWLYSSSAGGLRIGSNVKIAVQGYCDSSYIISKYAIVQNGTVIATAKPGPSDVNGLSKNYTFSIPAEKLIAGAKLQVCMEVWDNAENKVVDTLNTNLNVSIYSKSIAIQRYNSGGGVSSGGSSGSGNVSVSGDVPMTPCALDLGKGVKLTLRDKTLSALKGMSLELGWSNTSLKVEVVSSDEIKISLTPALMQPDDNYALELEGEIVLKYSKQSWRVSESSLKCTAIVGVSDGHQFFPLGIPVYISWSASLEGGVNITAYYDSNALKLKMHEATVFLAGKLELRGGVGCSLASVGVYGSTKMSVHAKLKKNVSIKRWDLQGEVGLYFRMDLPKLIYKRDMDYKYKISDGTLVIYENGKWLPKSSAKNSAANIYLAENYAITTDTTDTDLETDVKIVRLSSNKVAKIYMVNINSGTYETAATYDDYNNVKLVYQIGTLELDGDYVWGDPVVLDDNGLNDGAFNVYYDKGDGNAYIAYSQTSGKIGEETTAEAYVGMTEIKAAKWNGKAFDVMETNNETGFVSGNGIYDNAPIMTIVNGTPVLVWSSNTDNNFLGVSDYNYVDEETGEYFAYETNANTIWYSMFDGKTWSVPAKVADKLPTVNSYVVDNSGNLVFSVDPDSNPLTTDADGNFVDDSALYQVKFDANSKKFGTSSEVKNRENTKSINSAGDKLVYTYNGVVYNYKDDSVIADTGVSELAEVKVIKNTEGENSAILFTQRVDVGEESSGDAVFGMFFDGTEWSKPVQLTKAYADKNINSYDAAYVKSLFKDKLVIDIQYVTVNEKSNELDTTYEFSSSLYEFNNDIIVNFVKLNQDDIVAGEPVAVVANITNNSANTLDSVDVKVLAPDGKNNVCSVDITIKPGETADVEFVFTPYSVVAGDYTVNITTSKEADETDNSGKIKLAYSDLAVYSKQIVFDDGYYLVAGVTNKGNIPASGTLYVAKDIKNDASELNANEDYLYKIAYENMQPGYAKYYKISLDEEFFEENENTGLVTLFAENDVMDNESNTENNYEYISTVDVTDENLDKNASLPTDITPYMVDDYFAYEISQGSGAVTYNYEGNGYTLIGLEGVSSDSYTNENNAITFTAEYVKSLGEGEHQFTAIFKKGEKQLLRTFTLINFANYYNVTFQVGDETTNMGLIEVGKVPEFTGNTAKASDDKYDYKFTGWDIDGDAGVDYLPDDEFPAITGEMHFVAVYEAVEKTVSVIWDADGRITKKQYKLGETPVYYGSTEKTGANNTNYVFCGWDSDGDGVADIDVGETFPVVKAEQKYTAVYTKAITITKADFTIDLSPEKYTGEQVTKEIVSSLVEGKDFTVTYSDNTSVGIATIKINGIGNYVGELSYTFEITDKIDVTDAITFTLNSTGTGYTITDFESNYNGDVVIPEEFNGLPVNAIGKNAFRDCAEITSVYIPDSVTTIGGSAFMNCTSLKEIRLPQYIKSIPGSLCYGCTNLKSVTIPDGVYNIGGYAFGVCPSLTKVVIPDSVGLLGDYLFEKNDSVVVFCNENTTMHTYAINNNIAYVLFDDTVKIDTDNEVICTDVECGKLIDFLSASDNITYTMDTAYAGTGSVISVYENDSFVGSFILVVNGDVNGDSVCDALDAAQVANASNGLKTIEGTYKMAADNNRDDEIDIMDYQAIVNRVVA